MRELITFEIQLPEAYLLKDAINTERMRVQDRACEAFSNREPDGPWLIKLSILDGLLLELTEKIAVIAPNKKP